MSTGAWRIAVLFTAIALGSAYVNGYEWLRFFSLFGSWGTIGIVLTSIGLSWFTYTVLRYCHQAGVTSLHQLFVNLIGPKLAPSLSVFTHVILLAYMGAVIGQQAVQFADSRYALLIVFALSVAAFWLARQGMRQIVQVAMISITAGLLLIGLIFTEQRHVPIPSLSYQLNGYWAFAACYYLALHLLLSLAALLPLASRTPGMASVRLGIAAGGFLFFMMTLLGHAVLLAYWHEINTSSLPLRDIVSMLFPSGSWMHALVSLGHSGIVLAAVYYGLAVPVVERYDLQLTPMLLVMWISTIVFAMFPLWNQAFTFYPYTAATYCGMFILAVFIWKWRNGQPKSPGL